jgi:hypothetical protein
MRIILLLKVNYLNSGKFILKINNKTRADFFYKIFYYFYNFLNSRKKFKKIY